MRPGLALPTPRFGRVDMYHDGRSLQILEINVGSEIGGIERAGLVPEAVLEAAPSARGLGFIPTHKEVVAALREARPGTPNPLVAIADAPSSLRDNADYWAALAAVFEAEGLRTVVTAINELQIGPSAVRAHDKRVDLVLRYASVKEIDDDPRLPPAVDALLRAASEGLVTVWTPPHTNALGSKHCLAIISDPATSSYLTPRQRGAIASCVPWTRSLNPRLSGRSSAEYAAVVRFVRDNRTELVLKPADGHGGAGVSIGAETSAADWDDLVAAATHSNVSLVVQQHVHPRVERFPRQCGIADQSAAYGAFFTPRGPAGLYARVLPHGHGSVIGISASATTKTAAVLVREPSATPTVA